jgi:hypothetical protein
LQYTNKFVHRSTHKMDEVQGGRHRHA